MESYFQPLAKKLKGYVRGAISSPLGESLLRLRLLSSAHHITGHACELLRGLCMILADSADNSKYSHTHTVNGNPHDVIQATVQEETPIQASPELHVWQPLSWPALVHCPGRVWRLSPP